MTPARVPSLTVDEIRRLMPAITAVEDFGHGGQKQVFKAIIAGQTVALKVVLADHDSFEPLVDAAASTVLTGEASTLLIDEPEDQEEPGGLSPEDHLVPSRLRREVDLLAHIDSPCVVPLIAIDGRHLLALPDRGRVYMAYAEAWIEGEDLDRFLAKGTKRMPQEHVVRLALDGIIGITALWDREVVHRDIKPHNIMRRANGRFVLIDLGLALDIQAETITETGAWLGTLAFAAPEINDPELRSRVDFRADLFSLGIVLYEALAAQHPYGARTQGRTVTNARHLMRELPARLTDVAPDTDPAFSEMVMRMIQADFELRYARLSQVENVLQTVARNLGVQP
ncbi:MAG: serine/threonine protein kinase [Planctomycetes bacterium]|nr:serine/threonine protein kinase [Planctomycetota bacterium]